MRPAHHGAGARQPARGDEVQDAAADAGGEAEIVGDRIAQHVAAAAQCAADRLDGGDVARVIVGDETEVGEQQARVESAAAEGVDEMAVVEKVLADAGYPAQLALGLKPWAVTMFLADSPCQRQLSERGLKPIDSLVLERAQANGAHVVGLETTYEQYRSLASIPPNLQAAWLKASIELHPRVDDISQTMSELYRFRRLDAAWTLTQEMAPNAGLDDMTLASLRGELVGKRNARMLERALPLLDQGGAFIAIGAMHQIGSDGLVAMLRKRGFTLSPIE